jgi:hypothetical protein
VRWNGPLRSCHGTSKEAGPPTSCMRCQLLAVQMALAPLHCLLLACDEGCNLLQHLALFVSLVLHPRQDWQMLLARQYYAPIHASSSHHIVQSTSCHHIIRSSQIAEARRRAYTQVHVIHRRNLRRAPIAGEVHHIPRATGGISHPEAEVMDSSTPPIIRVRAVVLCWMTGSHHLQRTCLTRARYAHVKDRAQRAWAAGRRMWCSWEGATRMWRCCGSSACGPSRACGSL